MDKAEKGMRKELDDTKNEKDEWKVGALRRAIPEQE